MVTVIDHALATFSQHTAKLFQARYITLGAALVDNGVGVGEKFGQVYGNAAQLVNAVTTVFSLRLPQYIVEEPGSDLPAQQLLPLKAFGSIGIKPCSSLPQGLERFILTGLRVVTQFATVEIKKGVIDKANAGE